MAGHSKWAQIKHKKAILDSKRGKQFTKLIKEITVAARVGGGDPAGNPRLRFLLEKAKNINMPQDNAARAVKKGTGELPGVQYESHIYEGYAPGNVALIIEVLTDNKNKAIAEVRHFFSRNGGRIADAGSVSWMFERAGVIYAKGTNLTEDALLELLLDYDIKDITLDNDTAIITCDPKAMEEVKDTLTKAGLTITEAELEWVPKSPVEVSDEDGQRAMQFVEGLEELDDVQNVYTSIA